jgi:hypothetical protein
MAATRTKNATAAAARRTTRALVVAVAMWNWRPFLVLCVDRL